MQLWVWSACTALQPSLMYDRTRSGEQASATGRSPSTYPCWLPALWPRSLSPAALLPRGSTGVLPTPLHAFALAACLLLLGAGGGIASAFLLGAFARPPPPDPTLDKWVESEDWVKDVPCNLHALAAADAGRPRTGRSRDAHLGGGHGAGPARALFVFWGASFRLGGGGSTLKGAPGGCRGRRSRFGNRHPLARIRSCESPQRLHGIDDVATRLTRLRAQAMLCSAACLCSVPSFCGRGRP